MIESAQEALSEQPAQRMTHIEARPRIYDLGLREMIRAHELIAVFTLRQISIQYKQAVLGIGWAILNPIISTAVFTLIFGKVVKVPSEGLPYALFVLSGLVTWQYFSRSVTGGTNSLVSNAMIVTKVYFPRMALPLSVVLAGLADLMINLVILLALMAVYGFVPGVEILMLPVYMAMMLLFAFALSLWLSALNALYRDIGFAIPLILQAWMFLTPVVYPVTLIPAHLSWLLDLNPMSAFVQGARWAVLPAASAPTLTSLSIAVAQSILLLLSGALVFHKVDAILTDRI